MLMQLFCPHHQGAWMSLWLDQTSATHMGVWFWLTQGAWQAG